MIPSSGSTTSSTSGGDNGSGGSSSNNGGDDTGGDSPTSESGARSPWRRVAIVAGSLLGVLVIAYGVAFFLSGDQLARGATVAGIEVGGMTPAEAEDALEAELPALADVPIEVIAGEGGSPFEIVPSQAGLTIDIPATVDSIPGGSANPVSLVRALLGAGDIEPVAAVDTAALTAAVEAIAAEADTPPVNGSVAFDAGTVVTSEPAVGRSIDLTAAQDGITAAFFGAEGVQTLPISSITVPMEEVQPAVGAEEVARVVSDFAEPAMSGPVTIVAGEESAEIGPELIGQALTLAPDDSGTLQPALDGATLTEVARDALEDIGQEGQDATIRIENGQPVVVPSETGQGVTPEVLSAAVLPALTLAGEERQAAVELAQVDPELNTEAAEQLGVKEILAEKTTQFPHADYRNTNIGLAAERIDNTLLLPGDTFSLNGLVGERTEANGFAVGWTINGGRLVEDYGGGVSQVATTTYHAAFLAGLEDVEHRPHTIYFDRYPVGQEATVSWGSFDMAFKNDTPYGVLVDTSFSPSSGGSSGSLTVRIWSTKHFDVETSVSERSNFTSPSTVHDDGPNCTAQSGWQGFDITSYRVVRDPTGTVVKDESFPWTYRPNPNVVCGQKPPDD